MKKNGLVHSFSGVLRTIVVSSDLSKSRMATRITSLRLGYTLRLTNSSIPDKYASGK